MALQSNARGRSAFRCSNVARGRASERLSKAIDEAKLYPTPSRRPFGYGPDAPRTRTCYRACQQDSRCGAEDVGQQIGQRLRAATVRDVQDVDTGAPRAKVTMKAGDVAAMPSDIRHQGYSAKRSMLLVWENASPELPEMIRTGKASVYPVDF